MWQTIKATFLRNQASDMHAYPWSFTFGHVVNGLYIVLISWFSYHFLIQGQLDSRFLQYTGSSDYLTYAVIGGVLSNISVSMMMNVSRPLFIEYRQGTLEAVLMTPSRRLGYLFGTTLQQFLRIGIELIPVLLLGLIIGIQIPNAHIVSALLAAILYFGACFTMGLTLGAVMLAARDTYLVQNTLFSVTALVCGFQFPRDYLPDALRWFGEILPITQTLHMLRSSLMNGRPLWSDPQALVLSIILILFYGIIGYKLICHTERAILVKIK